MLNEFEMKVGTRLIFITTNMPPIKIRHIVTGKYLADAGYTEEQFSEGLHLHVEKTETGIDIVRQSKLF